MCPLSNEDLGRGGHIVLHSCAASLLFRNCIAMYSCNSKMRVLQMRSLGLEFCFCICAMFVTRHLA